MAKYTVEYSCGHWGEVNLYGPGKERERKIEWFKNQALCPDCYKASKNAVTAKANVGFADLEGSDKQIVWALDIRGKYMADAKQRMANIARNRGLTDEAAMTAWENNLCELVNKVTTAKWWIENRNTVESGLKKLL